MPPPGAIHLRPAAGLAERVLLPGDPHRALAVAQDLLEEPKMFNHARGLWGYTGRAADGAPLTIQSTGMGGPSAAIVVEELVMLGARTFVRIGTCGALARGFELGDLVCAERVIPGDGAGSVLGAAVPDRALTAALARGGARPVAAVSTDLFYDPRAGREQGWASEGAEVVEMEAATVLGVARRHGLAAAVVLAVTDLLGEGERVRIERDDLEAAGLEVGRAGYAALTAVSPR